MDTDQSGDVTAEEFSEIMTRFGSGLTMTETVDLVRLLDRNNDGTVSLKEFKEFLHSYSQFYTQTFDSQQAVVMSAPAAMKLEEAKQDEATEKNDGAQEEETSAPSVGEMPALSQQPQPPLMFRDIFCRDLPEDECSV